MSGIRKLRSAAIYGGRHLETINEDVQNEESYSRSMRTDLNLAIKLLRNAPDMTQILATVIDYVDAGCVDLELTGKAARKILASIQSDND